MVEKNPWWRNVSGPFPKWEGPIGCKEDGGGSHRGRGTVGNMLVHRAVNNHDKEKVVALVDAGESVNEVEAAGNTPLHCAAYEGWTEGIDLLVSMGAMVNASNNAGDRPWHWARNMGQTAAMTALEKHGASQEQGLVLVPDHIPKVKDFFQKDCWAHHPKPYQEFMTWRAAEDSKIEADRSKLIPGM